MFGNLIDYRTAYDDRVRMLSHQAGLLRIRNAETDHNRQLRVGPYLRRHLRDGFRQLLLHTGDAFARDVINKTGAALDDEANSILWSRWRNQVNVAQTRLAHQLLVIARLFRRQIQDQQSIHSRSRRVPDKTFHSAPMHQIEVEIEHDRDLRFLANRGHCFQNFRRRGARLQSSLRRKLVYQAVSQGITEWHPQFEDIHSHPVERQGQLPRGLQIRIARANVNNEPFLLFLFQLGKSRFDPVHQLRKMPKGTLDE